MNEQEKVYYDLEKINKKEDPWKSYLPYRKKTFKQLLSLIQLAPHQSILEVGCAQGHFTEMLTQISDDVTAIDVSSAAVEQARKNVKGAKFYTSSLEDFDPHRRFDVIVCSEILCYIKDREQALGKLQELGDYLVTSNFLVCFPRLCFSHVLYEWDLRRFRLLKRIMDFDLPTFTLVPRSLWKMKKD